MGNPLDNFEAFERARDLCKQSLTALPDDLPAHTVANFDDTVLRPARELQVAGLCLLEGQSIDVPWANIGLETEAWSH
jgi:hypothetical protein